MLEGRFKNFKKISGGYSPLTPNPHASIFAGAQRYARRDLGEKI